LKLLRGKRTRLEPLLESFVLQRTFHPGPNCLPLPLWRFPFEGQFQGALVAGSQTRQHQSLVGCARDKTDGAATHFFFRLLSLSLSLEGVGGRRREIMSPPNPPLIFLCVVLPRPGLRPCVSLSAWEPSCSFWGNVLVCSSVVCVWVGRGMGREMMESSSRRESTPLSFPSPPPTPSPP